MFSVIFWGLHMQFRYYSDYSLFLILPGSLVYCILLRTTTTRGTAIRSATFKGKKKSMQINILLLFLKTWFIHGCSKFLQQCIPFPLSVVTLVFSPNCPSAFRLLSDIKSFLIERHFSKSSEKKYFSFRKRESHGFNFMPIFTSPFVFSSSQKS